MYLIKTGWREYELYSFTGIVTGMGKVFLIYRFGQNSRSHFSEKGKWLPPVSVETTTNAFNHIFLTADDNNRRSINMNDFDIACREGHELTAIWAVKKGEHHGPYVVILNNTTKQAFFSYSIIIKMFDIPFFLYVLIIPGSYLAGYLFFQQIAAACLVTLPAILLTWFIGWKISTASAKKFIASFSHNVM